MRLNNYFDFPGGLPRQGDCSENRTETARYANRAMDQTFGCVEYTPLPSETHNGNSNAILRIMRFHASLRSFQGPPTSLT
jgi:hypothetical protein